MAVFSAFLPLLTVAEGGYQKDTNDTGNYNSLGQLVGTNHGISAPVYEAWIGYPPSETDMRNMSKNTANSIYKQNYWNKIGASYINNQSIANILVDHAVNAGAGSAGKIVQRVLNEKFGFNLAVDGAIGEMTRAAINAASPQEALFNEIKTARENYYISLNNSYWLQGWLNRLELFVFAEKKKSQQDYC